MPLSSLVSKGQLSETWDGMHASGLPDIPYHGQTLGRLTNGAMVPLPCSGDLRGDTGISWSVSYPNESQLEAHGISELPRGLSCEFEISTAIV